VSSSGPSDSEDGSRFSELAKALGAFKAAQLSGHPSDRALADATGKSPSTIGDWLRGTRFPQELDKFLIVVRMVRAAAATADHGIASPTNGPAGLLDEDQWRAAHRAEAQRRAGVVSDGVQRAQADRAMAPSVARVRAGEADFRLLGVHAAISVPGVPDEVLPEYVPRDADAARSGIRAKVAAAADRGGFVVLVGGSSVGKTRCAAEAVRALLPGWWLVHPAGPGEVAALARAPFPRMVVWLDELQRYIDGEQGVTGGMVRALLNAPHPAMIIATLWPDRYTAYTALPAPGGADPHAREREVLDLATVVRIAPEFTAAEQDRAHAAAGRDPRLKIALDTAGYGLTQTLAAAPQLVARWEDAKTAVPYAWAVLTAALDAARLGAHAPLSADFLRAAAVDYCTSAQQAEAPDDWFEQALAYATAKLHGAAAALSPAGAGMGQVAGYIVADYLLQHASRKRRSARPPASTWNAALAHIHNPADAARLAASARNQLLYRYDIPLYRRAAVVGDMNASLQIQELSARRGDLDELRVRAYFGDRWAAGQLARLPVESGVLDELRSWADAGEGHAAEGLAWYLAESGDLDELRSRADAGDGHAANVLIGLLIDRDDEHGLMEVMHLVGSDSWKAALHLTESGDLDELRSRADTDDGHAAEGLARLLAKRGDLDELRSRADTDDGFAASQLARLLARRGEVEELRARADAGDIVAARLLARLLAERGDLDELRSRADAGDGHAAEGLARLLAERGDLDELRSRIDVGDGFVAGIMLIRLLIKQGRGEEAERLRRFGLNPDGSVARE
jgi:hypothetical protein